MKKTALAMAVALACGIPTAAQEHDMYYIMEYHPVNGSAPECDRSGKAMIIAGNDHIKLRGSRDHIYYCTLEGGVYDDPALAECMAVEDSVGAARAT